MVQQYDHGNHSFNSNPLDASVSLRPLHSSVLAQATLQPLSTAVICNADSVSYQQLARYSTNLSEALIPRDDDAGVVAVLMDKGWQQAAACLGVLQSGYGYVPLLVTWPEQRLLDILHSVEAHYIVATTTVKQRFEHNSAFKRFRWLCLEQLPDVDSRSLHNSVFDNELQRIAYVIFTSGSTGVPKGVVISHGGAANTLSSVNEHFSIGVDDAVLGLSQLSFDLSVYDMFGVLSAGGRLVLPDADRENDPQHWVQLITENAISIWNSVPMYMNMLVTYLDAVACGAPRTFDSLRVILLSGDWIPIPLITQMRRYFPNARIVSLGGATEASVWSVWHEVVYVDSKWKSIPYGAAMPNQTISVFDDSLRQCAPMQTGQIYIGGAGVALGYWKDEKRTKQQFIRHPATGQRLYRTGDLGRYLTNGEVEFLGREDTQIKLGGHRVELGEIEAVASRHEAVKHGIAAGFAEHNAVYLYVVPDLGLSLDSEIAMQDSHNHWREVYDQTYRNSQQPTDETFNTAGWVSRLTGKPYTDSQMVQWVDLTIDRLTDLKPKHVLEVGCGTGLLLFRLAPLCQSYCGVDFSAASIEYVERVKRNLGSMDHIELVHCSADDYEKMGEGPFDTIIINSVAQHFYDPNYLDTIIEYYALHLLSDDGVIFVGDVPNYDLSHSLHAQVIKRRNPNATAEVVRSMLYNNVMAEKELFFSPSYFYQLQRRSKTLSAVECMVKTGSEVTEMNMFRFDAVIYKKADTVIQPEAFVDYSQLGSLSAIETLLRSTSYAVAVQNIPNKLLSSTNQMMSSISSGEAAGLMCYEQLAMHDIEALAAKLQYGVKTLLHHCSRSGNVDAVFFPQRDSIDLRIPAIVPTDKTDSCDMLTNHAERCINAYIRATLPLLLKKHLPEYMLPQQIVFIERFPLSQNGKVDRTQLAFLGRGSIRDTQPYVAPRNELDNILLSLVCEVLHERAENIGIRDDFFALGGDSLSVVSLVTLAWRHELAVDFQQLYLTPTIESLSDYLASTPQADSKRTDRVLLPECLALLPNQQSYAYIQYMSVITYRLVPAQHLVAERVESALQKLVARHESLRLYFQRHEGAWMQRVFAYKRQPIVYIHNLHGVSSVQKRHDIVKKHCDALTDSIDVEKQNLGLRAALFQWDDGQYFFLAIDHFCMDQLSMSLFWREFDMAYRGQTLPVLRSSYREVVNRLFALTQQWDWRDDKQFWSDQLSRVTPVPEHLQTRSSDSDAGMKERTIEITEPWVKTLLTPGYTDKQLRIHDVMLTAWVQTLTQWMDSRAVVLILGSHNRDLDHAMMQTMGCFITSYPLYIESDPTLTASEAIAATHRTLLKVADKGARYALLQSNQQWRDFVYSHAQPFLGFNFLGEEELVSECWQTTADTIDHQQVVVSHGQQQDARYKSVNNIPYLVMLSKLNRTSKTLTLTAEYADNCYSVDTIDRLLNMYCQRISNLWHTAIAE